MESGFKTLYGTNSSEICGSTHPWFPNLKSQEADNLAGRSYHLLELEHGIPIKPHPNPKT